MSALESPPSLAPVWQDPWTNGAQIMDPQSGVNQVHHPHMTHDFYGKYQMYPGVVQAQMPSNQYPGYNCDQSPAGSNSSDTLGSNNSNNNSIKKHRAVNFKLDIKPEPNNDEIQSAGAVQKVPSLSDVSDQESCSLDIPVTQVSPKTTLKWTGYRFTRHYIFACLMCKIRGN